MPELVSRPGVVISPCDAAALVNGLTREPGCPAGIWRAFTNRWELWSGAGAGADAALLATIEVAHNVPYPHAVTLLRVEVTHGALAAGLDGETVCDLALQPIGKRLADCSRSRAISGPPVFTGHRRTERAQWEREVAARLDVSLPARLSPGPTVQATAPAPAPALDEAEDRELRRLHYLAAFGGLSGGLAERYAELRGRDRRASVREPQEDDLVVVPGLWAGTDTDAETAADGMEPVTGAS